MSSELFASPEERPNGSPEPRKETVSQPAANELPDAETVGVWVQAMASGHAQHIQMGMHSLQADLEASPGGDVSFGPTPMELLMAALGACTNLTIQLYAQRKGWSLSDVKTQVTPHYSATGKLMGLQKDIRLEGDLSSAQWQRLKTVAARCPIHQWLSGQPASLPIESRMQVGPTPAVG